MAYSGRRGPNVSEYIANLNAIPTAQDLLSSDTFALDDDLAMFTNTQFFDFDLGQDADLQPANYAGRGEAATTEGIEMKPLDFDLQGDFSFSDFNEFAPPHTFGNDGPPFVGAPPPTSQPGYAASASTGSPSTLPLASTNKRKSSSPPEPENYEDASRFAAEEDKRRRNTAASARFRVKKKQREQALEKSAKEMSDKVAALESRVNQLETENKWLKNLITEKNESKEDIAALWKKYSQETAERKASERKDGVGTKA